MPGAKSRVDVRAEARSWDLRDSHWAHWHLSFHREEGATGAKGRARNDTKQGRNPRLCQGLGHRQSVPVYLSAQVSGGVLGCVSAGPYIRTSEGFSAQPAG